MTENPEPSRNMLDYESPRPKPRGVSDDTMNIGCITLLLIVVSTCVIGASIVLWIMLRA